MRKIPLRMLCYFISLHNFFASELPRHIENHFQGGDEVDNDSDQLTMKSSSNQQQQPINYAYSSSTLPRARKQRKPLYEVNFFFFWLLYTCLWTTFLSTETGFFKQIKETLIKNAYVVVIQLPVGEQKQRWIKWFSSTSNLN